MNKVVLENIRDFWRPITSIVFAITLIVVLILCLAGAIPCSGHPVAENILWIMAAFLGVHGAARSFEKVKENKKSLLPESPSSAGEGNTSSNL